MSSKQTSPLTQILLAAYRRGRRVLQEREKQVPRPVQTPKVEPKEQKST